MRLIDADELKTLYDDVEFVGEKWHVPIRVILANIDDMPTVDPVKHGRWITSNYVSNNGTKSQAMVYTGCKCSVCGGVFGRMSDLFCYHCGAKMDEVSE